MLQLRLWSLWLALFFITPFTLAEEGVMSTQQQCAEYGVYQDVSENWIECSDTGSVQKVDDVYDEPYAEEAYEEDTYEEETYVEEPYVEESYIEEPYVEESYVEESYVEEPYAE